MYIYIAFRNTSRGTITINPTLLLNFYNFYNFYNSHCISLYSHKCQIIWQTWPNTLSQQHITYSDMTLFSPSFPWLPPFNSSFPFFFPFSSSLFSFLFPLCEFVHPINPHQLPNFISKWLLRELSLLSRYVFHPTWAFIHLNSPEVGKIFTCLPTLGGPTIEIPNHLGSTWIC